MPKTSKAKPAPVAQRFEARLERMRSRLNWVIIYVPFDAAKVWGTRGQIKVKGEINGFAFRTSLFPAREGRHILLVNKRMQKGARAVEGSVARFQMELDCEERMVSIPDELQRILGHPGRSSTTWHTAPGRAPRALRRSPTARSLAHRPLALEIFPESISRPYDRDVWTIEPTGDDRAGLRSRERLANGPRIGRNPHEAEYGLRGNHEGFVRVNAAVSDRRQTL